MEICLQHKKNESAWQAVNLEFFSLFKEKLNQTTNRTECSHVQPPKELTTEALFMIIVMTIFVISAVLGSLITAFEFLCKQNTERTKPSKSTDKKSLANNLHKKDWISNTRLFFHCFCFVKNGKELFRADHDQKQFACLHGIRVFINMRVLCYHIGKFIVYTRRNVQPFVLHPIARFLFNEAYAINSLFVMSGFLNGYTFSKTYKKNTGKVDWWNFYLKRYVRLTPLYMIVLGVYTTLMCYGGSGPIWPEYSTNPVCKENWWRYVLYINNFELCAKSCMLWCWYLAVDMQLYIISPLFLLSLLKRQGFGYILVSITIFLSSFSSFIITKRYNLIHLSFMQLDLFMDDLKGFTEGNLLYGDKLYCKPYNRITPYLFGVLLGYYLHSKNFKDFKNRPITLCFGWITSGILSWICFYLLLRIKMSVLETAVYNSVKHICFSAVICWIIFFCLTEQKSFLTTSLSWKCLLPLSKLSFSTNLIHMLIIKRESQAAQEVEEFSVLSMVYCYLRIFFWTFVFSVPASLLFEMPVINLFDLYTKNKDIEKREERKEKFKKT